MLNKAFRRASKKETLNSPGGVRWHDEKIGRNLSSQAANHIEHWQAHPQVRLIARR